MLAHTGALPAQGAAVVFVKLILQHQPAGRSEAAGRAGKTGAYHPLEAVRLPGDHALVLLAGGGRDRRPQRFLLEPLLIQLTAALIPGSLTLFHILPSGVVVAHPLIPVGAPV